MKFDEDEGASKAQGKFNKHKSTSRGVESAKKFNADYGAGLDIRAFVSFAQTTIPIWGRLTRA
jgi:hypothetical protein